jgi:hypothetical protein
MEFNSLVNAPDPVNISFDFAICPFTEVDTSVNIPLSDIPLKIEISNEDE